MDISSYILSKRYVDETIAGAGAVQGAPCQIQSIEQVDGGNKITFLWELKDGTTRTETIFVRDGEPGTPGEPGIGVDGQDGKDGVGIVKIEQTQTSVENGGESLLKIYLSDGTDYSFVISTINGKDGATPEIGPNGHWIINGIDTGIVAAPDLSSYYNEANLIPLSKEEIDAICETI